MVEDNHDDELTPEDRRRFRDLSLEALATALHAYPIRSELHTTIRILARNVHRVMTTPPRNRREAELIDLWKRALPKEARLGLWGPDDYEQYFKEGALKNHRRRIKRFGVPSLEAGNVLGAIISLVTPYRLILAPPRMAGGEMRSMLPGPSQRPEAIQALLYATPKPSPARPAKVYYTAEMSYYWGQPGLVWGGSAA
jgi:hypothetical protein